MILNLWVSVPWGVAYQISCISAIYITMHNGSNITVVTKIILWILVTKTWGSLLKSHTLEEPLPLLVTLEPEIKALQVRSQHQGRTVSVIARQYLEPEPVSGNYQVVLSESKGFFGPSCRPEKEITRCIPQHLSYTCLLFCSSSFSVCLKLILVPQRWI